MTSPETLPPLAPLGARTLLRCFADYQNEFLAITRRAKTRFEQRDWHAGQADAMERLSLRDHKVHLATTEVQIALGTLATDKFIWAAMKHLYAMWISSRPDALIAETFFNSVTRRIFATVGVEPAIEFLGDDFAFTPPEGPAIITTYPVPLELDATLEAILRACNFEAAYPQLVQDARVAAAQITDYLCEQALEGSLSAIEIINPRFFRGKGVYIVGQLRHGLTSTPLILAFRHPATGVRLDAVLLSADEASIVFSFTRSYFHVDCERPHHLVAYLEHILPQKPTAEIYISIGYHKHGKTELFRGLMRHLAQSRDQFVLARGEKGMVMTVFTLPSLDIVFKIIRDRFAFPKTTTRAEVRAKYQEVFQHDRAGRLVDAQEFEHLEFDEARFAPELLAELLSTAADTVTVSEGKVRIKHLYTERKLIPLNLFLREAAPAVAREAVLDYGQAIKDLAATNTFPGDMLLKNFGVTRHGRVIFYDYDEVTRVTECNFRDLPQSSDYDEEMSAEPWYYVAEGDIFPEEFIRFMGFPRLLREAFLEIHADLFTPQYWRGLQARLKAGEIVDIYPYKHSRRLP